MKRTRLIILLAVVATSQAFATRQEPEILVYRGETNDLHSTPLEPFFTTNRPRPEIWSTVRAVLHDSGCWRCYVGTWAIQEHTLYLTHIRFPGDATNHTQITLSEDGVTNIYASPLKALLPGKELPIKADWFSGVIRLPKGEALQHVHMGFGSIYERDHFIKIQKGKVIDEKIVDNLEDPKLYTSQADLQWQEIGKMTEGGGVVTDDPFALPPDDGDIITDDPFAPQPDQSNQGDWHDARMIRTTNFTAIVKAGTPFLTRGIFVRTPDELFGDDFALFIPPTPLTQRDFFPLTEIPAEPQVANGSHVEIKAVFKRMKRGHDLHVLSLRELNNNESIHRRDYRLPNKSIDGTSQ